MRARARLAACLFCVQAEPSFGSQVWRTLRTLGGAFILVTCLGTLLDDKGLGKSLLNNPDLKPQLQSNTRFADVKGVDEAKVCACERVCVKGRGGGTGTGRWHMRACMTCAAQGGPYCLPEHAVRMLAVLPLASTLRAVRSACCAFRVLCAGITAGINASHMHARMHGDLPSDAVPLGGHCLYRTLALCCIHLYRSMSWRRSLSTSRTPASSRRWAASCLRACCSWARPAPARPCWRAPSPARRACPSSTSQVRGRGRGRP